MIVLIVLGVLVGVAIPSYRDYVVRSNRSEARAALLELANAGALLHAFQPIRPRELHAPGDADDDALAGLSSAYPTAHPDRLYDRGRAAGSASGSRYAVRDFSHQPGWTAHGDRFWSASGLLVRRRYRGIIAAKVFPRVLEKAGE